MADMTVGNNTKAVETTIESADTGATTDVGKATTETDETTKHNATPTDTAETVSTEPDVPTKDSKSLLRTLTDGAKKASKTAWEYTAQVQERANKQANKPATRVARTARTVYNATLKGTADVSKKLDEQPRDFFERAGKAANIAPKKMRELRSEGLANKKHEEHGVLDTALHMAHGPEQAVHYVHRANVTQAVVRNAGWIQKLGGNREAAKKVVGHGEIAHAGKAGKALKWAGGIAFGVEALGNGKKVWDDLTDADGLSIDSLQPIADTAASAIGTFGGPVGTAFGIGYTGGQYLDEWLGIGDAIDRAHDRSITGQTQIGFLTDRAKEMDLGAAARIRTGTYTDRDVYRARSIVREAREHGILGADGHIDRRAIIKQLPGMDRELVVRVERGIQRAVELEQTYGLD